MVPSAWPLPQEPWRPTPSSRPCPSRRLPERTLVHRLEPARRSRDPRARCLRGARLRGPRRLRPRPGPARGGRGHGPRATSALTGRMANTTNRAVLDALDIQSFNHVIVLCEADDRDPDIADARILLTLLHLRDIGSQCGRSFSIVSEMLDERNRELAEVAQADDFIVSCACAVAAAGADRRDPRARRRVPRPLRRGRRRGVHAGRVGLRAGRAGGVLRDAPGCGAGSRRGRPWLPAGGRSHGRRRIVRRGPQPGSRRADHASARPTRWWCWRRPESPNGPSSWPPGDGDRPTWP